EAAAGDWAVAASYLGVHLDFNLSDSGNSLQSGADVLLHAFPQRASGCGQNHSQRHHAILHLEVADHVEGDEISMDFGVLDRFQCLEYRFFHAVLLELASY